MKRQFQTRKHKESAASDMQLATGVPANACVCGEEERQYTKR